MKAAYLTAPRTIEIRDDPEPAAPRASEVLARIERVGVCGSDVHYFAEGRIGDQALSYPVSLGHECSATILEVGDGVENLRPGQRIAIDPAFPCGTCDQCRLGRENTCRDLLFMGAPRQAPGALRERCTLPASSCFALPENVGLDEAVLVEPLSVALHALSQLHLPEHPRIGILGAGPIGLCVLLALRATTSSTCYVSEPLPERRDAALRCGADWCGDPHGADVTAVTTEILEREPLGLDIVFECSGEAACHHQAPQLLAPGGQLCIIGIPQVERIPLDIHTLRRRELTLRNVRRQNRCVAPAVELVAQGRIDFSPLITHRVPIEESQSVYELVEGYRDGVIKALITPSTRS